MRARAGHHRRQDSAGYPQQRADHARTCRSTRGGNSTRTAAASAPMGPTHRRRALSVPARHRRQSCSQRWRQLERDFTISRAREYRKSDASLSIRGPRTMRTGSTTWIDSTMTKFKLLSVAAILSTVILAFLTTLRPIAITAVDARANEAATLAHSLAEGCTAREPSQFFPCNCGKPNCL